MLPGNRIRLRQVSWIANYGSRTSPQIRQASGTAVSTVLASIDNALFSVPYS